MSDRPAASGSCAARRTGASAARGRAWPRRRAPRRRGSAQARPPSTKRRPWNATGARPPTASGSRRGSRRTAPARCACPTGRPRRPSPRRPPRNAARSGLPPSRWWRPASRLGRVVAEHVVDAHHRPPPEDARGVDERARRERPVVGGGASAGDAGHQRAAVDGAGRGADDEVEARGQPEALERRGHAGRDDPAHAAALEHERDAVGITARARARSARRPPAQDVDDRVRQVGRDGGVDVHGRRDDRASRATPARC